MTPSIVGHIDKLKNILDSIEASDANSGLSDIEETFSELFQLVIKQSKLGGKLFFIGNGASASISSHISTDLWKNSGIKAHAFNDSSVLTCISNDFGYKNVFSKPLEMFADDKDILVAISSSGSSENILRAVALAKQKGLKVVTLSGFKEDNPLRKQGDLNFYVPVSEYGYVEIVHHSILHFLVDTLARRNNG